MLIGWFMWAGAIYYIIEWLFKRVSWKGWKGRNLLDKPVMWWSKKKKEPYTWRHLTNGGLFATGFSGSGKTSSLKLLAMNLLAHGNTSILVMCAKR